MDFYPILLELIIKTSTELPEDITARYDAVFGPACGEAFETILGMIDRTQLESIERAARRTRQRPNEEPDSEKNDDGAHALRNRQSRAEEGFFA